MSVDRRETLARLGLFALAAGAAPFARAAAPAGADELEPEGRFDTRFGSGNHPDGRAILPQHPAARRVWLDTTRSGGDGRSPDSAFGSEAAARARLSAGDQLMIAGGSRLSMPIGDLRDLPGRSPAFPTVIQSYDRRAPLDESRHGLLANGAVFSGPAAMWSATLTRRGKAGNVAIRGLRFNHSGQEFAKYSAAGGCDGLLVEQCAFVEAMLGLNGPEGATLHVIRQSGFYGAWSRTAHAQGIFTSGNRDTVIEDCVFYHCGWRPGVPRSAPKQEGGPTMFNHAVYAAVRSGGVMRRCVMLDPASHGAQLRGDWVSHDNVFIACPIALVHGQGTRYAEDAPKGVSAHAYRIIVTVAQDIAPKAPRGYGIEVANTRPGSVIEQALIVGRRRPGAPSALAAAAFTGDGYEPNDTDIRFVRNTNLWSAEGMDQGTRGVQGWPRRVHASMVDGIGPGDGVRFVDPTRDGVSAARALGFAGLDRLGDGMIAEPGKPWARLISDHIRPGYAPTAASRAKVRNPDGSIKGAVLPNGRWNDGRPYPGWS